MIVFISDLHLTPQRPEATGWFENFMVNAVGLIDEIYILGDLFEVWVGDDASDTLGQGRVEEIMRSAASAGVKLWFMHGNRDFLVGEEFAKRAGCVLLPDPFVMTLGGEQILLTHGDALCTHDVEHQRARARMLSSKWKAAFLGKPIAERMDTAWSMREKSEAGKREKSAKIMDVDQRQVENVMRKHGVRKLIHGHTHSPAVHEFMLDNRIARRYVMGDWYTQKSLLFCDNGNFALQV